MKQTAFLERIEALLRNAGIAHMLTGSLASSAFGRARSTEDVDIVIDATPAQLEAFLRLLPDADYYVSREAARDAMARRSMFNVIDMATSWKADLIFLGNRPFDTTKFSRRQTKDVLGVDMPTTTAEDSILSKLEWRKESRSERQYDDALRVAIEQWASLDQDYLRRWAAAIGVAEDLEKLLFDADAIRPKTQTEVPSSNMQQPPSTISQWVQDAISTTPVYDLHTHLYPSTFGPYMLWGVDEMLTYHYLIAETIRATDVTYESFWSMNQKQRADLIWKSLFLDRAPISEACRGVVTVLKKLGLDLNKKDLNEYRRWYISRKPEEFVDEVFKVANVHTVVMTNDALDSGERDLWLKGTPIDPRFKAVLRIDPLLLGWPKVADTLRGFGYDVSSDFGEKSLKEIRRFLVEWIDRMNAIYVAVSLPPSWRYPDDSPTSRVIRDCILPVTREKNLPLALMVGVTRQVNPQLRLAGDSVAKADVSSLERLLAEFPKNKFMATFLSRENQYELAVTARKFRNLFLFGCWWFLNNPSLIEEMTRMRMEMLGETFVPQHSDCRILDQLIYKWDHSRRVIAKVLSDKFTDLANAGWPVTQDNIRRTAKRYLSDNFADFIRSPAS